MSIHVYMYDGHEFEQAPGDIKGQGSLVCCSPWGHKEVDMTEQLTTRRSDPHYDLESRSFFSLLNQDGRNVSLVKI